MKRKKLRIQASPLDTAKRKELVQRTRELSALLSVAEVATQSLDPQQVLDAALDKSLELLHFNIGYIRIFDPKAGGLVVRVARGLESPEFLSNTIPIDPKRRSVGNIIFATREPQVSSNIRNDPRFSHGFMARDGLVSAAFVPVMSNNNVLGLLMVGSPRYHKFSKREINLLMAFGAHIGAALENARLYDEVNKGKTYIENLVENAGDAIVASDLQGQILSWNRGAEIVFGFAKDEVVGKHVSSLVALDSPGEAGDLCETVAKRGFLRDLELQGRRRDGKTIYLSTSISQTQDHEGQVVGLLFIAKDITEKKSYQERLQQLDKLKSDFVSNVSHELRTPLTAIKGAVDNMMDGITGDLTDKQKRYLDHIKGNSERLRRLIADLLDLSKIEAGKVDLRLSRLSAHASVTEIVDLLANVAVDKSITLEVAHAQADLYAWGDRDKVAQVLTNLIGNAIHFTPMSGRVAVSIEPWEEEWIRFGVVDTGPGIRAEDATRIFNKFEQLEQANRKKTQGTGLGLAISKALVELQGGKIWVESEFGNGSAFFFTLPMRQSS